MPPPQGPAIVWGYRLLGGKMGRNVRIQKLILACPDHDLLEFQDDVVMQGGVFAHNFANGSMVF